MTGGMNEGIGSRTRRFSEHYKEYPKLSAGLRIFGCLVGLMAVLPFIVPGN
jgi:hypothetical protein